MPRAVGRNVVAQGIQILSAAFVQAVQRSLQSRQNLDELSRRLHRRIDQRLGLQFHAPRLLQETKRETRDDAESVLAVRAPAGKSYRDALLHAISFGQIG